MGWYKSGSVNLTHGVAQVIGVGTDFVTYVTSGGIFCAPDGQVYEVDRVESATSLYLVKQYAGATVAGAPYAVAPTQSYIADLGRQAANLLNTFSGFRDDYIAGNLVGAGLKLKGVLNSVGELPPSGADGDAYLIDGSLYVWAKAVTGWRGGSIRGPKGDVGDVNPANVTAAAAAQDGKTQAAASAAAASASQLAADGSRSAAATSAAAALSSQTAAAVSETNAAASATAALASKNAAGTSATNAATSATAAQTAQTAASTSQTAAAGSATAAATSKTNAGTSEANAKTSEVNAKASETASKTSETNAAASATSVGNQAAAATTAAAAAQDWATKTSGEVAAGQGYGAKKYATDAAASAAAAAQSAQQASAGQVNSDWNATSGAAKILNKPAIPAVPGDIGLGSVNNTADSAKPVSVAQAAAIATKEPAITPGTAAQYWAGDKSWKTLDKSAVGLGSVDNTPDASKPVSTAQQAALDAKAPKDSPTFTGPVNEAAGADIPSAGTINLTNATGNLVDVTGAVTISAITLAVGAERTVRFVGGATLKNGVPLVLLGGADIVTAVGDFAKFRGYAGGVVRMVMYSRASGTPVATGASGIVSVGATVTDNVTLAAASPGYQFVQMAALGKSVKLPDATTMTVGGPRFIIDNTQGAYPVGVRDNAGTLVMAVGAGGEGLVSLKSAATAAGVWSVAGSNLEPGLISIDTTFSNTYASYTLAPFVALDANTSIHFAALASGFAAFVVDSLGKVVSVPVTISVSGGALPVQCFKISATQAIVFYGTGPLDNSAVVLTLTGSSPSLSLSVGTPANSTANFQSIWGGEDFVSDPKLVQLTSTLYLAAIKDSSNGGAAIAISVSGSTVTFGSVATGIGGGLANAMTLYPLTATTALLLMKKSGPPSLNVVAVLSVSGTTVSQGTVVSIGNSSLNSAPASVLLSPTKALILDDANTTGSVFIYAITISGTSVAVGVGAIVESGLAASLSYALGGASRRNPRLWATGANTAGLWYVTNGIGRAVVLTENAGSISIGAMIYGATTGLVMPQGASEFLTLKNSAIGAAGYGLRAVPCKVSGTTITVGSSMPLYQVYQDVATSIAYRLAKLAGGDYAVLANGTSTAGQAALPILRSNGDTINHRGDISIPELTFTNSTVFVPNTAANRFTLVGCTASGSSLLSGGLLRVVNVEVAA